MSKVGVHNKLQIWRIISFEFQTEYFDICYSFRWSFAINTAGQWNLLPTGSLFIVVQSWATFVWAVWFSLVPDKQDPFYRWKDATASLCCLSLTQAMALAKIKYLIWEGFEKGAFFPVGIPSLFTLKYRKEHDTRQFGELWPRKILSCSPRAKRL